MILPVQLEADHLEEGLGDLRWAALVCLWIGFLDGQMQ